MDVNTRRKGGDITGGGANQKPVQSEGISVQPTANGTLPHHTDVSEEAPPPRLSDWSHDGDTIDDSVMDASSTNDVTRLVPGRQRGVDSSSESPPSPPPPLHGSTNQKCLSSTKSPASMRSDTAHLKEVAGDEWCVHCLLACLFCDLSSMCSVVGECLLCGVGGAWCCDAAVGCCSCWGEAACTEGACPAAVHCGIREECCDSSDCLEVCLECCSICFPS
ncbi:MyoD family inhibitor domain-containing protein [Liparis tanakae]|uniref:MyoD family inhibitor domain-containing protein n=1 Tax=Liparis tanakae TaxID=230148 RepID=A0A4Z2GZW3_9TELE|nr:MyoD family inhibitor domain-containing protein [Liparis tanakae]